MIERLLRVLVDAGYPPAAAARAAVVLDADGSVDDARCAIGTASTSSQHDDELCWIACPHDGPPAAVSPASGLIR